MTSVHAKKTVQAGSLLSTGSRWWGKLEEDGRKPQGSQVDFIRTWGTGSVKTLGRGLPCTDAWMHGCMEGSCTDEAHSSHLCLSQGQGLGWGCPPRDIPCALRLNTYNNFPKKSRSERIAASEKYRMWMAWRHSGTARHSGRRSETLVAGP